MYTDNEQNAVNEIKKILDNYEKFQGKVGYLIEDRDRKILFCNQQFCNIFNIDVSPDSLIGGDCTGSADQVKHMFVNPTKFVEDINIILTTKNKKTTSLLEMVDGTKYRRDYVPMFFDNNYIGHSWQYYRL